MIAVKLSESESWIKLVTSNYCTCDLWTTLLLGGKPFPIIEAFFFGVEFRPHSVIPVTWNQYNIYSHTSGTYRSVEGHRWLVDWLTKTHPPSTPVENCHPLLSAMAAMIIENEEKMVKFVGKTSCKWTILLFLSVEILRSSFCSICGQINSPV